MRHPLQDLARDWRAGRPRGIASVCSAHPVVIEAALIHARDGGRPALIEATCNQVNHEGGYTGMTPAKFRALVERTAARAGCAEVPLILGGDHLGPNPWTHLPAEEAMTRAERMVAAYAAAGFDKLHLDTSMACADDAGPPDDATVAARAARLARVAEAEAPGPIRPVYVIGTEVPVPGGVSRDHGTVRATRPEAVEATWAVHRDAFRAEGLEAAFERVVALVVQPGVEFGDGDILAFDPEAAAPLTRSLRALEGVVFEAHSTDYQTPAAVARLVEGGFVILKVGPWLTHALREALYGLDAIADVLDDEPPRHGLMRTMEEVMTAEPRHWRGYHDGSAGELFAKRHFSLSDRIRYYWPVPKAASAVEGLLARLEGRAIPGTLARQYLPHHHAPGTETTARAALLGAVRSVLSAYDGAGPPMR